MSNTDRERPPVFAYAVSIPYSGQTAASEFAVEALESRGWDVKTIRFMALDRARPRLLRHLDFILGLCAAWFQTLGLIFSPARRVCFNHGQSYASFARMGIPHLLLGLFRPDHACVTSLHGNVFMGWDNNSILMRIFLRILKASRKVTILGEKQRQRLLGLGVPDEKLVILPNTSELTIATDAAVSATQDAPKNTPSEPVRLLHLSLLLESKGYPVFLDAAEILAGQDDLGPVEIVLCGPAVLSSLKESYKTEAEKADAITERVARIDALGPTLSARWIPGARGAQKQTLFDMAHLFVMPTRYPVEVQPIVLIEAFASGCPVIVSDQGEIPSMVTPDVGILLEDVSPANLAEQMRALILDHERRKSMALAATALARDAFSKNRYGDNWEALLRSL